MFRQYRIRNYSFPLAGACILLATIGLLVIGSAQESYQSRQLVGMIIGIIAMFVLSLADYTYLLHFRWIFYVGVCLLLAAVLVFGENIGGATRWITIAGIQFQPSDLMKLVLILFFSGFFAHYENRINSLWMILLTLVLAGVPLFLTLKEPDLSTTIATAAAFCVIMFAAGLSMKIVIGVLAVAIPAVLIVLNRLLNQPGIGEKNYQVLRILAWLHPTQYPEAAMQQQNSIIAIGSGQLFGKGLNNDAINSVKNGNFISESQTDFIFAVAGEELGFAGCVLIVILELIIGLLCIRIAMRARDKAGALICIGMGSLILIQSTLNICVTTGLLPNTGITLPFVSYGNTSLVIFFAGIGVCLNVGLQPKKEYVPRRRGPGKAEVRKTYRYLP